MSSYRFQIDRKIIYHVAMNNLNFNDNTEVTLWTLDEPYLITYLQETFKSFNRSLPFLTTCAFQLHFKRIYQPLHSPKDSPIKDYKCY